MTIASFGATITAAFIDKWLGEKLWTPFQPQKYIVSVSFFFFLTLENFLKWTQHESKNWSEGWVLGGKKNPASCVTPGEMSYGRLAGGRLPPPLNPIPHHHHYSHIHGPHLSNQISWCVQSAVTFYMNYKPAYMYTLKTFPLHEPAWKWFCDFTAFFNSQNFNSHKNRSNVLSK